MLQNQTPILLAAVALLLATAPPLLHAESSTDKGSYQLTQGNLQRTYLLHRPAGNVPGAPIPAVLLLHGGGGSAESARTIYKMDELADRQGFMTVYPQGYGRTFLGAYFGTWNAGECCNPALEEGIDDVGFFAKLIDELVARRGADPKRIYVAGHSNGALMAYRLACELSDKVAAIAPSGAQTFSHCKPSRPVPILHVHGTADRCTPYQGGSCGGCLGQFLQSILWIRKQPKEWPCGPVPQAVASWAETYRLTGPETVHAEGNVECRTRRGTSGAAEVTLCTIPGHGHVLPNGEFGRPCQNPESRKCRLYKETMGPNTARWDFASVLWHFFSRHALEAPQRR